MSAITARNDAGLVFTLTHTATGSTVRTDPPTDHGGDGSSFSPTQLCTAALAACTGSMIGAKAKAMGLDPAGLAIAADLAMTTAAPRRIAAIELAIDVPFPTDARQRHILIQAAKACTVGNSLHPDIKVTMTLRWSDGAVDVATH